MSQISEGQKTIKPFWYFYLKGFSKNGGYLLSHWY